LRAEGVKALNRTLLFGFGKTQKYEDAAENFKNAGNAYKLTNSWQSAGDCFIQASEAYAVLDQVTDVTASLVEAAQCYKKINPVDAVSTFRRAIDIYNQNGRFGMSSRYCKEMAEIYEQDNNSEMALAAYEEAAELFDKDGKKSNGNQCLLKVATIAAEKGDLARAAGIYESIGKECMSSRLGSYSAKGYFFQCLLCYLAMGDNVQVQQKVQQCKNVDFSFQGSRECDFIERILKVRPVACWLCDLNHVLATFPPSCTYLGLRRGEPGGVRRRLRRLRPDHAAGPLEDQHAAARQEVHLGPGGRGRRRWGRRGPQLSGLSAGTVGGEYWVGKSASFR
jgi:alpha-soluble NSF attachment protein